MDPGYGGIGLPHAIDVAMHEMLTGACTAFNICTGLSRAAANVLKTDSAPDDAALDRAEAAQRRVRGHDVPYRQANAGSAVGDNRLKAVPTGEEGVYHLTGEKIFISGGDNDITRNIAHLVLARAPDAPAGTRGLSLFVVPKFLVDKDGNSGARNDAMVVGIEHKMGINGSATCTIALGANGPCVGYRIGKEGQGMEIMFLMMNEARIGVGIQGLATASASYLNALAYAKDRVQGSAIENMRDADAPRVTINQHPDVRRMLMTMKVSVGRPCAPSSTRLPTAWTGPRTGPRTSGST